MSAQQRVFGIVTIGVVLLAVAPAKSQTKSAPKSAAATDALTAYKEELAKLAEKHKAAAKQVDADFVDDSTKLKTALLARLEQARKDATKADDLDEAIRIRDTMHEVDSAPIMVPMQARDARAQPRASDSQERKKLEAEIERLNAQLSKKETAQRARDLKELADGLVGTKWKNAGDADHSRYVWELLANGQAVDNGDNSQGRWSVEPDGAITVAWASGYNWTMYVKPGLTSAIVVSRRGQTIGGHLLMPVK